MKRSLSLFLLSLMLFSQTELYNLLKLPVLVQHYWEHEAKDRNITFSKFIVLHYFSGNIRDKDYDRDMQLPFKTHDCMQLSTSVVIAEPIIISIIPFDIESKIYLNAKNDWIPSRSVTDIFQPPQFS